MKKKFVSLLCTLALALTAACSLTGCGGVGGGGGNNSEYVGSYDADRTYITVSTISSVSSERVILSTLAKAFQESQNEIGIKMSFISDYTTGMLNYITNKNMPDLLWTAGDLHTPYTGIANPYFEDLTPWFEEDDDIDLNDLQEVAIQSTHSAPDDDRIWFAPRDTNRLAVIINKEMFAAAGVAVPSVEEWNYNTFINCCKELRAAMDANKNKSKGITPTSYPLYAYATWSPVAQTLIRSYGGNLYDTANKTPSVNSEESIAAYKKLGALYANKYLSPADETANLFSTWDAAMALIVRTDLTGTIADNMSDVDFRENPFAASGVGTTGWAMNANASDENKELAWEFIKFMLSEEGQNVMGSTGSSVPVLKSMANSGSWTQYRSASWNHTAFTAGTQKDFSLNDVFCFRYDKQAGVKKAAEGIMTKVASASFWSGSPLSANPGNLDAWSMEGNWASIISAANAQQNAALQAA